MRKSERWAHREQQKSEKLVIKKNVSKGYLGIISRLISTQAIKCIRFLWRFWAFQIADFKCLIFQVALKIRSNSTFPETKSQYSYLAIIKCCSHSLIYKVLLIVGLGCQLGRFLFTGWWDKRFWLFFQEEVKVSGGWTRMTKRSW